MVGLVVLVLVLLDVLNSGWLTHLDHATSRLMLRWDPRHSAGKPFIYAFTLFGQRGTVLGVSAPIVAWLCWRDRSLRVAGLYILALVLIAATVYGLKLATSRTAPPVDGLHVSSGASFPSGHLVNATVLWWLLAACALLVPVQAWIARALTVVAWLAPASVIVSMTLLDYHWLTDFAAALGLGVALRYPLWLAATRLPVLRLTD